MQKTDRKTLKMVQLALFAAIVLMLALIPNLGYIPLGVTRATIIHIPVIVGSIILGPVQGGILGFIFGLTSLLNNTFSPTVTSFVFTPFYTLGPEGGNPLSLVICFVPRILVGVVPYYVYKLMSRWAKGKGGRDGVALAVSGLAGSLTNTILVMNMIYLFFGESYAAAKETSYNVLYGAILSVIAVNGLPEAALAAILTAAVCKALLRIRRNGS